MWRSYFTVAIRALGKSRTFTFINIFGLALGLAAGLIMLLYVRHETGFDRWLPGHERAFQVQTWFRATADGGEEMALQVSNIQTGRALAKDFPQIENAVFLIRGGAVVVQDEQMSLPMDLFFVDGNLFDILQFPFVRGDPRTALDRPNSLVMTEAESRKRFGTTDSIGRSLTLVTRGGRQDYVVTGVLEDIPGNTHIRPLIVARFDPAIYFKEYMPILTNWVGQSGWTYVKLRPGVDADAINRQLPAWERRNIPDETTGGVTTNPGDVQDWRLVNIADVHLGAAQDSALTPGNDRSQILTFAIIALLTLGMAIANFTNLATARASQRAREVAMRKVLGAGRGQLIAQFLGESILVAAIATTLGLAMVELALPYFNHILGTEIVLSYLGEDGLLLPSIVLAIVVGVVGGLYPAFCLSRFQPTQVLKANKSVAEPEGSGRLRNMLVIAQFAVSIGLIICTAVIYAQTLYARTSNAGYDREGLLQINRLAARQAEPIADEIKQAVERVPGVQSAALTSIRIDPPNWSEISVQLPGDPKLIQIGYYGIDTDYIDTMAMTLLAGRKFDPSIARDDATTPYPVVPEAEEAIVRRGVNVVMSESAIHRLGFETPEQAVGKEILTEMSYPGFGMVPTTIVGVVKDVRYRSVREPIQPIMYFYARTFHSALMVRYKDVPAEQVMADLREAWEGLVPGVPFSADFVDDRIRELYRAEESRGQIFGIFALIAVIIGCLGLFGLAAFTAERRTKEIGIRKVLGARTWDIVKLLAWQFSKPVIIANAIAWPVAWWAMRDWLSGFEYRVNLGPEPFLAAGLLALVIAIATIAAHAVNVARANPVQALRYE